MSEEQTALLEVFANPQPNLPYRITHECTEFTSVCPKTGHPDFGTIFVDYVPSITCVELKALKLYLQSYRNKGVFYETGVNEIFLDLQALLQPFELTVRGEFKGRGGITSVVEVIQQVEEEPTDAE